VDEPHPRCATNRLLGRRQAVGTARPGRHEAREAFGNDAAGTVGMVTEETPAWNWIWTGMPTQGRSAMVR